MLFRLLSIAFVAMAATARPALAADRVALVIGNSAYVHAGALANPHNDAGDVAAVLSSVGFKVIVGLDVDKRAFDLKIREFARSIGTADIAVLFYAGHGLQVAGRNYLLPVDAALASERDLDFDAVSLDFVMRQMEVGREGRSSVVFLDACRDNPLARNLARTMGARSSGIGAGLAQVQTGVGTFIAYSTQPGNVALDGQGRNSPFTSALVKHLGAPGRNLTSIMVDVRRDVLATTGGRQVPWDHSALTGELFFHQAAAPAAIPRVGLEPPAQGDVQQRLRQLEEELKKKADPRQTEKVVELAQARERRRQLEEANREDQSRIFELQRASARSGDAGSGRNVSAEIGQIQMRIGRRAAELRTLRERIGVLEGELGVGPGAASGPAKAAN